MIVLAVVMVVIDLMVRLSTSHHRIILLLMLVAISLSQFNLKPFPDQQVVTERSFPD